MLPATSIYLGDTSISSVFKGDIKVWGKGGDSSITSIHVSNNTAAMTATSSLGTSGLTSGLFYDEYFYYFSRNTSGIYRFLIDGNSWVSDGSVILPGGGVNKHLPTELVYNQYTDTVDMGYLIKPTGTPSITRINPDMSLVPITNTQNYPTSVGGFASNERFVTTGRVYFDSLNNYSPSSTKSVNFTNVYGSGNIPLPEYADTFLFAHTVDSIFYITLVKYNTTTSNWDVIQNIQQESGFSCRSFCLTEDKTKIIFLLSTTNETAKKMRIYNLSDWTEYVCPYDIDYNKVSDGYFCIGNDVVFYYTLDPSAANKLNALNFVTGENVPVTQDIDVELPLAVNIAVNPSKNIISVLNSSGPTVLNLTY